MPEHSILQDLVVIFSLAILVVAVLRRVGIPTIAGFILTGTLVGPGALQLVSDIHQVEILAEFGVALLLFGIGVEISVSRLQQLWRPVMVGGALQVAITGLAAFGIALATGMAWNSAVLVGFLIAVSSTAIVLRGLDARGETEAPHGQLTLGVLLFQDLSVVPMMLVLPLLAGEGAAGSTLALAMGKTVLVLAGVLGGAWFVVPRALHWVAETRQRDLFALAVFLACIGTAWMVSKAGVSLALGAFLAGLVVAGSEYRHQALAELIPFREVLTSLFFVSVGMLFDPTVLMQRPGLVLGLLAAVILGKFLIIVVVGALMKLPLRTAVLAGTALCQVGEFSFVLMAASRSTGLLSPDLTSLLLTVIILSMLLTPLALMVGPHVAAGAGRMRVLTRLLQVRAAADAEEDKKKRQHTIIAGFGVSGQELAWALKAAGLPYVIVDLNPANVRVATERGEPAYYGDVTSPEVLEHVGAATAKEIVIAVNDPGAAERAIAAARRAAPSLHIVVRARFIDDVDRLVAAGAHDVVPAELEAAVAVTQFVLERHRIDPMFVEEAVLRIRTRLHR